MMDHASSVRPCQLVCSTAIANICLSVKWIISKKGFYSFFLLFTHLVPSEPKAAAAAYDYIIIIIF